MLALFDQSPGHAGELEAVQAVEGGVGEHGLSLHR
jgi:hypothetical protein